LKAKVSDPDFGVVDMNFTFEDELNLYGDEIDTNNTIESLMEENSLQKRKRQLSALEVELYEELKGRFIDVQRHSVPILPYRRKSTKVKRGTTGGIAGALPSNSSYDGGKSHKVPIPEFEENDVDERQKCIDVAMNVLEKDVQNFWNSSDVAKFIAMMLKRYKQNMPETFDAIINTHMNKNQSKSLSPNESSDLAGNKQSTKPNTTTVKAVADQKRKPVANSKSEKLNSNNEISIPTFPDVKPKTNGKNTEGELEKLKLGDEDGEVTEFSLISENQRKMLEGEKNLFLYWDDFLVSPADVAHCLLHLEHCIKIIDLYIPISSNVTYDANSTAEHYFGILHDCIQKAEGNEKFEEERKSWTHWKEGDLRLHILRDVKILSKFMVWIRKHQSHTFPYEDKELNLRITNFNNFLQLLEPDESSAKYI